MTDAETIRVQAAEIRRVMGEEWWSVRDEDLEISLREVNGEPMLTLTWRRSTPDEHHVTLIGPEQVAELRREPDGSAREMLWSRPMHGERELLGVASAAETDGMGG